MKRNIVLICCLILLGLTGCGKVKEEKEYENIYALVQKISSLSGDVTKYSDYTYDEKTGLITSYKEGNYTIHTLKYDDNGNMIEDFINKEPLYGTETDTYTYNDDNTIATLTYTTSDPDDINNGKHFVYTHEKDEKGRVIKTTTVNTTRDNYTMVYTYEYDESNRVKVETQTTNKSSYRIEYEYDEFGNKIKEAVYKDSDVPSWTISYKYEVIGKIEKIKK